MSEPTTTKRAAPPQLMFDDGSRIMTEESTTAATLTPTQIRGSISLEEYYEIDRIAKEIPMIITIAENKNKDTTSASQTNNNDIPLLRVALQFPDELLDDSPEVCWMLEERLQQKTSSSLSVMVFCLGDTTVGSCCPDEVAALHLQADVLVHYGHACLSPTGTLPVIYSFGKLELNITDVVEKIRNETAAEENEQKKKILVLYHVGYHHAMNELQMQLQEKINNVEVVLGQLPKPTLVGDQKKVMLPSSSSCCGGGESTKDNQSAPSSCCGGDKTSSQEEQGTTSSSCCDNATSKNATTSSQQQQPPSSSNEEQQQQQHRQPLIVGGLELPEESSLQSWDDLSEYTILFIGDPESTSQRRQYVNSMLRFLSLPTPPQAYWTYSPTTKTSNYCFTTSLPNSLNLQLKRRFFLTQKARDAHVFGIVVSNLSQQNLINVVKALDTRIQIAEKASYNFAVGKINPAKLANFAEIECFVLVACREHSLLDNERDYPVPVITPLELDIALGNVMWGTQAYSLDCLDVLLQQTSVATEGEDKDGNDNDEDDDEDDDAPYFSLVTGKYVQKTSTNKEPSDLDLEQLPGKGQVTAYKSEAANFLKQREYQGLDTAAGQTEVKAAIPGQQGIASNYGDK